MEESKRHCQFFCLAKSFCLSKAASIITPPKCANMCMCSLTMSWQVGCSTLGICNSDKSLQELTVFVNHT